jgi:pSer/pThr/pTyr-binding forkhead associated (FHA) protein
MTNWSAYETPALRIVGKDGRGTLHALGNNVVVGRGGSADIQVLDPKMSQFHLRVFQEGEAIWAEDLDTKNGTYLNCVRFRRPTRLSFGDSLIVGHTVVQLLKVPKGLLEPAEQVEHRRPPEQADEATTVPPPSEEALAAAAAAEDREWKPAVLPAGFEAQTNEGVLLTLEGLRSAPVEAKTALPARIVFITDGGAPSGSVVLDRQGALIVGEVEDGAASIDGAPTFGRAPIDGDTVVAIGPVTFRLAVAGDVPPYAVSVDGDRGFVALMPLNAPLMHVQ